MQANTMFQSVFVAVWTYRHLITEMFIHKGLQGLATFTHRRKSLSRETPRTIRSLSRQQLSTHSLGCPHNNHRDLKDYPKQDESYGDGMRPVLTLALIAARSIPFVIGNGVKLAFRTRPHRSSLLVVLHRTNLFDQIMAKAVTALDRTR